MEAAFGWVQQIWDFLVSWLPHLELLTADKGAVKFHGRGKTKELRPGYYWFIPALSEVREIKVNRQTTQLSAVVIPTSDAVEVAVSAVVIWRIADVIKAVVETDDIEDAIDDLTFKALGEVIASRTWDEILKQFGDGELAHELSKKVRADLKQFGVHVEFCFLSELTRKFYRIIGDDVGMVPTAREEDDGE